MKHIEIKRRKETKDKCNNIQFKLYTKESSSNKNDPIWIWYGIKSERERETIGTDPWTFNANEIW